MKAPPRLSLFRIPACLPFQFVFICTLLNCVPVFSQDTLTAPPLGSNQAVDIQQDPSLRRLRLRSLITGLEKRWQEHSLQLKGLDSITLEQAIQTGLSNNPILSKAYAGIQSAEWQTIAVRREWFPSFAFSNPTNPPWSLAVESSSGNQSNLNQPVSFSRTERFYTSPRLRMQWSFLDPTRTPRLKSTLALAKSQQLLFDVSARNLVLDIQEAYFNLQEASELREDYTRIYELTRYQLDRARQLRRSGLGTRGDIDQLRSQLLEQLTQLIQIYQQQLIAANQLAYVLSLPHGTLVLPSERLTPMAPWQLSLPATIQRANSLREEILSYLAQAESASWLSRSRLARYLPLAALFGQSQYNSNNLSTFTQPSSTSLTTTVSSYVQNALGLNFSWLLFDGGISAADSSSLTAQSVASLASAQDEGFMVTLQVQNSYAVFDTSQIVISTAFEQLRAARATVDYTSASYNGSSIDATTFIQNIQNYLKAAKSYKAAVNRYNVSVASLYRYSALWPGLSYSGIERRIPRLKRQ